MHPTLPPRRVLPPRPIRLLAGVLVCIAALTACGGPGPVPGQQGRSAQQVLDDSATALRQARSYHVSSDTIDGVVETSFDLDVIGNTATGTISQDKNWTLHMIDLGDTLYVWGKSYWADQLGDSQARQIGDRCLRVTPFSDKVKASMAAFTRFADTAGYAAGISTANGTPAIDGATTSQGRPAISVSDGNSKVDVDAGSPSYPLRIEVKFGSGLGYTNFSKFNQVTQVLQAPNDCLDLAQLTNAPPAGALSAPVVQTTTPSPAPLRTPNGTVTVAPPATAFP